MGRNANEKAKCRSLLWCIPNCGEQGNTVFVLKAILETVNSYSPWREVERGENGQLGILVFHKI